MICGLCGSIADRSNVPNEAIGIRQIGWDPRIITDPSDLLGALVRLVILLSQHECMTFSIDFLKSETINYLDDFLWHTVTRQIYIVQKVIKKVCFPNFEKVHQESLDHMQ